MRFKADRHHDSSTEICKYFHDDTHSIRVRSPFRALTPVHE